MTVFYILILGLAFGSFVNALVWRLHEQSLSAKKRAASLQELSIVHGRSMCPHCKHTLCPLDLVPVISWVLLGGKCHYCRSKIGLQYPLVELITACLFAVSYIYWPHSLTGMGQVSLFVLWLTSLVGLVALVVYDIRWMVLPNKIVFPLIGLGIIYAVITALTTDNPGHSLLMSFLGLLVAGGIFYVLFQISDGKWIGGGDVKLGFALGLLLSSPYIAFLMLFLASLLGLLVSMPAMLIKKSSIKNRIPFGPFLVTATIICVLFGQLIIDWYTTQFLYM